MIHITDIHEADKFKCWESKSGKHEIVLDVSGGWHFTNGEAWDDIQMDLICRHCGTKFHLIPESKELAEDISF